MSFHKTTFDINGGLHLTRAGHDNFNDRILNDFVNQQEWKGSTETSDAYSLGKIGSDGAELTFEAFEKPCKMLFPNVDNCGVTLYSEDDFEYTFKINFSAQQISDCFDYCDDNDTRIYFRLRFDFEDTPDQNALEWWLYHHDPDFASQRWSRGFKTWINGSPFSLPKWGGSDAQFASDLPLYIRFRKIGSNIKLWDLTYDAVTPILDQTEPSWDTGEFRISIEWSAFTAGSVVGPTAQLNEIVKNAIWGSQHWDSGYWLGPITDFIYQYGKIKNAVIVNQEGLIGTAGFLYRVSGNLPSGAPEDTFIDNYNVSHDWWKSDSTWTAGSFSTELILSSGENIVYLMDTDQQRLIQPQINLSSDGMSTPIIDTLILNDIRFIGEEEYIVTIANSILEDIFSNIGEKNPKQSLKGHQITTGLGILNAILKQIKRTKERRWAINNVGLKLYLEDATYSYSVGSVTSNNSVNYLCTKTHVSAAGTEPGVGATWTTVWQITSGSADGAWSGSSVSYTGGVAKDICKLVSMTHVDSTGLIRFPLGIMDVVAFNELTSQTTAGDPTKAYMTEESDFTSRKLNVDQAPATASGAYVEYVYEKDITLLSTSASTLDLPAELERFFIMDATADLALRRQLPIAVSNAFRQEALVAYEQIKDGFLPEYDRYDKMIKVKRQIEAGTTD